MPADIYAAGEAEHWSGGYTVPFGATASADDVALLVIARQDGRRRGIPTTGTWTVVENYDTGYTGTWWKFQVLTRVMDGGETGVTLEPDLTHTASGSNGTQAMVLLVSDTSGLDTHSIADNQPATVVAPSVTVAEDDSAVAWTFLVGALTDSPSAGTHLHDGARFGAAVAAVDAGATGTSTATAAGTFNTVATFAFGPAGSPTPVGPKFPLIGLAFSTDILRNL